MSREVIPGFVTRDRPEPSLEQMTLVQLLADISRNTHPRATAAMAARRAELEAEVARREARYQELRNRR